MPYIKQYKRQNICPDYETIDYTQIEDAGDLNFTITVLVLHYLRSKGLNYQSINDILGAFDGAKNEFYRRVVVPYEEKKIKENGDVGEFR